MANFIMTQLDKVQAPQVAAVGSADTKTTDRLASEPVEKALNQLVKTEDKVTAENKQSSAEELRDKVSQLNEHMQNLNRSLQFTVDEESGDSIVTVRDAKTEEIIRQFPSEELLKARQAVDKAKGMLIEVDV